MSRKTSMSSSQDHVADDLNRQELDQKGAAGASSYGSSGSTPMAPSSSYNSNSPTTRR
jgi:hypothetical protein